MRTALALSVILLLGACRQEQEQDTLTCAGPETESCMPPAEDADEAVEEPAAAETPAGAIDKSALNERKQPGRLLGYLAEAVNSGNWPDAALAWHEAEDGSAMDGRKLKALFGNPQTPLVSYGPGHEEGAAGSSYYEAPILLIDSGAQREGTITLRRVNDVPGAEDWQLAWHVERLEWKN